MGCGKTMQLIQVAFNYEERGQKVCVIKPAIDTKNADKLLTRIGPERKTDLYTSHTDNIFDIVKQKFAHVDCILVDEAQFLTAAQVDQLNEITIVLNIPVIAYGLRLNFRQTDSGFAGATRLLQIAHNIEEIKTICQCGKKATRQSRWIGNQLVTTGPDILIDDGSTKIVYRALCAKCYHKFAKQKQGKK